VRLAEAPSHGKTIFQYDAEAKGGLDYRNLAGEILGDPYEAVTAPDPNKEVAKEAVNEAVNEAEAASSGIPEAKIDVGSDRFVEESDERERVLPAFEELPDPPPREPLNPERSIPLRAESDSGPSSPAPGDGDADKEE